MFGTVEMINLHYSISTGTANQRLQNQYSDILMEEFYTQVDQRQI